VRHGGGRRRTVPVLDAGRTPDDVAGAELHDRSAPLLRPAHAGGDDEMLTRAMRVPRRTGTRLERDIGPGERRSVLGAEQRIDTHVAGEVFRRALRGRLRAATDTVCEAEGLSAATAKAAREREQRCKHCRASHALLLLSLRRYLDRFSKTSFATGSAENTFGQPA